MPQRDKVFTAEEIAKKQDVCETCVKQWIKQKKLEATFFRGQWHIRASNYRKFKEEKEKHLEGKTKLTIQQVVRFLEIPENILLKAVDNKEFESFNTNYGLKLHVPSLLDWYQRKYAI